MRHVESEPTGGHDIAHIFLVLDDSSNDGRSQTSTDSNRCSSVHTTDLEEYDVPDLESVGTDWEEWNHDRTDEDGHNWDVEMTESLISVFSKDEDEGMLFREPGFGNFSVSGERNSSSQGFN